MFYLPFTVMLYSFQSLFNRLYTAERRGRGALPFTVGYGLIVGVCTLALNGFAYRPAMPTLVLGLINGVALLIYNVSMVKCGTLGSYAIMMIAMLSGGILVPMVYDMLYLGTQFSALQLFAVALMLVAFVVMNLDGFKGKKEVPYLIWCAILFAANGLYGVMLNLQQNLMHFTQRNEMIITTFLGTAVLITVFELLFARKSFVEDCRMSGKAWLFMALSSISATVAVHLLLLAMAAVNVTLLNVVNNGGVLVVSAVFAFTLFREKLDLRKGIGIAAACVSIVLLSL